MQQCGTLSNQNEATRRGRFLACQHFFSALVCIPFTHERVNARTPFPCYKCSDARNRPLSDPMLGTDPSPTPLRRIVNTRVAFLALLAQHGPQDVSAPSGCQFGEATPRQRAVNIGDSPPKPNQGLSRQQLKRSYIFSRQSDNTTYQFDQCGID